MEREGKKLLEAEENLRIAKAEEKASKKHHKAAKKSANNAALKASTGDESKDYLNTAEELEAAADARLLKSKNRLTDAQNKYLSAKKKFAQSTTSDRIKAVNTQYESLKSEKARLDNAVEARAYLESFIIFDTTTNSNAQVGQKIHESVKTPERIVSFNAVRNLHQKGYIKLNKFTMNDYKKNSKKIQELKDESFWAVTAKTPGYLNAVYVITPADTTPAPKISLAEGFAIETKNRKARAARLKDIRKGIKG